MGLEHSSGSNRSIDKVLEISDCAMMYTVCLILSSNNPLGLGQSQIGLIPQLLRRGLYSSVLQAILFVVLQEKDFPNATTKK